jgi:hypothetical protein
MKLCAAAGLGIITIAVAIARVEHRVGFVIRRDMVISRAGFGWSG